MFVQRIPYQSVRRRRIRHWFLLLMRARGHRAASSRRSRGRSSARARRRVAAAGGSREVVILLDQSASMGYGDHWQRARDAAHERDRRARRRRPGDARALRPQRRGEHARRPPIAARLEAAHRRRARSTPARTRYGPALKLAESILDAVARSSGARPSSSRDFQKSGWTRRRGRALRRGHDADAGVGRVATGRRTSPCRRSPSRARRSRARSASPSPPASPNKGADAGDERAGHARGRRPRRSRRKTVDGRAPTRRRRSTFAPFTLADAGVARRRARRHRPAAGRQHVPLRR